jgi:hypothetical protein
MFNDIVKIIDLKNNEGKEVTLADGFTFRPSGKLILLLFATAAGFVRCYRKRQNQR